MQRTAQVTRLSQTPALLVNLKKTVFVIVRFLQRGSWFQSSIWEYWPYWWWMGPWLRRWTVTPFLWWLSTKVCVVQCSSVLHIWKQCYCEISNLVSTFMQKYCDCCYAYSLPIVAKEVKTVSHITSDCLQPKLGGNICPSQ